jgi:uncharacterized protein (DUF1501 family)
MASRRQFLKSVGAAGGGCLGLGALAPRWWQAVAAAAEQTTSGRRLVVIELQGGNDGLNTVIPFTDDAYYRARPTLAIPKAEVVKLDDHLGLHPGMKPWRKLWDAGQLTIVENCGYPQPNRSHFASMDIWHAGDVNSSVPSGWLGRAADRAAAGELCYVGEGAVPRALSRRLRSVAAMEHLADLRLRKDATDTPLADLAANADLASVIAERIDEVRELSGRLPTDSPDSAPATGSSNLPLAERMSVIRTLIEQDQPFRVYYTALGGFDTHARQAGTHESLWEQTSQAVADLLAELKKQKLSDGLAVFLFSEFGRRVKENGSAGTDHGAAAPVFVLGDNVQGGIQGGAPDLVELDNGDLRYNVDFRDVYASLLRDGLGVDPAPVLGARESTLTIFG